MLQTGLKSKWRLFFVWAVFTLSGLACNESATPDPNSGTCLFDSDCPSGRVCTNGVCGGMPVDQGTRDAGSGAETALLEDGGLRLGILQPVASGAVEFGAQRLGVSVQRTVAVENVGRVDLEIQHVTVNNDAEGEFSVYPGGSMSHVLSPGDAFTFTVEHTPENAAADFSELQIVHTGRSGLTKIFNCKQSLRATRFYGLAMIPTATRPNPSQPWILDR